MTAPAITRACRITLSDVCSQKLMLASIGDVHMFGSLPRGANVPKGAMDRSRGMGPVVFVRGHNVQ